MPMTDATFKLISAELQAARNKFPKWTIFDVFSARLIMAGAIVAEESGELTRATLHYAQEGGSLDACRKEAIQTAVCCIRFLEET